MSSGAGKLQSTVPSTELDEYGYLDFDIDEEYERQGEYDDEDREDEEEEEDDEEDDEDYERLARMGVITRPERDHRALPPQHTQSGGKVRVSAPPTGYHHLYSGYHGTINNNTVYTIPEEDEEHDMDANEEFQGVETSKKRSERKSSVSSSANSGLGGPMGTKSGKVVRGSEGTQRLLPSTAGPGGGRQCSSANPSPCSTPAKARNYRSNSEPFLEIARPLKRGGSGYPPNQPAMAQQKLFQQPPTQSQQHMQPKMMQGEAMMQANQAWSSQDLMGIRPPQNPQQGQLQQQQQQQQPQPRPPFGPNVTNQNLERDMYMLQQDISMTNRRSSLDNSMQLAMSTNKPFNNYGPQPPMNNGIINQMQQANLGYIPNSMGNKMQQDAMQYTMQMNQQPRLPHQTSLPVQFDQYKQQQQQNQLTTNQLNQTLQQQQQLQQQQPFGMNYQQQIEQAQRQSDPIRSQTSLDQKQMDKITISQHQSYPISIPRSMPLYNMSNQLTSQTQAQTQSGQMGSMGQSMMGSQVNVQVSNVASNVSLMPTSSTGRTTQVLQSQTNQTLAPTSQRNYPQQQLLQPNSAKNLQQFQDNTWPHSTELSPILDVSPSVEAAEAQEIQGNNRRTSLDKTSNNTNIPRAISGMIDDFNKAIENLSLTNNVDDPKYLRGSSLQNQENKNDSQPKKLSITATKSPLQGRRASTGQVDNLDHYERRQHSSPRHQSPQSRLQVNSKTNLETSLVSQTTNQDLESLRQHKVLLSGNSQIAEQQLQKQQQILIQQQQQFLQIQLEQQRIQTQIQEQMSSSAKQEQQLPHQSQVPSVQTRTESTKSTVAGARRVATSEANREIAVNTEPERMRDKAVSTVMKQDKQVSTSFTPPPSSLTSTPTGPITRYAPTVSSSRTLGGVESESTRTRVISASSTSSQHRRLPPSEETYYSASGQSHSSRPSSSVTSISQRSTSPQIGTRKPAVIRNIMPTGKSAVTFNRGCLAKPKEPTSVVKSTHQVQSFNTLGYLDLDTKNVTFDTGKTKRRKLPTAPQEDEPISSMLATKKLIKEKLSSVGRNVARNPLKSSSSLDSSFGIGPSAAAYMSKRPVSPFSSNSDITNFLASTYGRNLLKSPTSTNLADVLRAKDQRTNAGSQMSKSSLDEKLLSSCNFANEIKTIQQKIMEELKTSDPSTLLPSDLNAALLNAPSTSLTSLTQPSKYQVTKTPYDNLELLARNRRDMLKDAQLGKLDMVASRLKFPINSNANLPFKSYEYESLNPVRYSDNKYRLTRPMSSVSFYENDLGLRESSIPNCMNEDELLLRSQLLNSKRRFDGDILAGSKYDRYHSLYSKYDLAGPGLTGQRFGRGARTDLLYGGRDYRNTSRSWHPSPYVSDVSDEEDLEHELSVEEKTAKVRAEIKRRRQRLADSGRLYRHYSFDDYNVLGEYDSELDPLTTPYNPSHRDPYGKYNKYVPSEYPLVGSKEKYYSDDLDAYYPKSGYHGYSEYPTSRHNTRLYDSRLASQNYGYADEYYTSGGVTGTGAGGASSMPLLTDTTSRSRKMIDDLGTGVAGVNGYRAGYDHNYDYNYMRGSPKKTQFAPNTTKHPKYPFPIKRILLTQDPKIRSMSGDSLGLKVVGGKEIPGTNMIGAYIQRIHPSLSMNGEIREGMQVIEWNGIPLTGIAHDEVSRIIANQIGDEIEVVIRTDINLLQGQYHNQYHPGHGQPVAGGPPYGPNPGHYSGQAYYGPEAGMPPPHGVGPGVPPNSGPYYQGHYGGHGPPPPQASMHSGAPGPMHPSVRPGLGPVPQSTMQPVSQPQVILQHNHPVDDSIMYDQYGKMMHPPGPPMAPGGPGTQGGPPPGPMGMPPPGHHHPMMHQHPGGPPPGQIMAPPPTHHHNPMDAPYYPH